MLLDNCQFFYECKNCGAILKSKQDDCCVFCSYGSVLCPPIQEGRQENVENGNAAECPLQPIAAVRCNLNQ